MGAEGQGAVQLEDKYKSYDELERALRAAGVESIQLVVGFDFSGSNAFSGKKAYGKSLHDQSFRNPYIHVLDILEPIISKFDDDGIIPAFRFGCEESTCKRVVPLCSPKTQDPNYQGFKNLLEGYKYACSFVQLSGPTTFGPMIQKAIELEKAYGGRQLMVLIMMTDGAVSDIALDKRAIREASKYPISITAVGLGDGPFHTMIEFDDMKGGRDYDNFQFVDFTKFEEAAKRCENPELALATTIFNELPEQVKEMKRLGLL